nr:reverse transcriptase domain-containing protein [Tanacetum cinerariifolium]
MDRPASDAAMREYCDRNYHQLLPIIAKKVHQEKLKAEKARLNFDEVSQHYESRTPSRRRDLKKRIGSRCICSDSKSPRKKDSERKTMFKRLEKGIFHRLGDKGRVYSDNKHDMQ